MQRTPMASVQQNAVDLIRVGTTILHSDGTFIYLFAAAATPTLLSTLPDPSPSLPPLFLAPPPRRRSGGATNNPFCKSKNSSKCVDGSTGAGMTTYSCNPTEYAKNPFACEVGDMSGKFGKLAIDGASKMGTLAGADLYMSPLSELRGKSIVFHCDGGARVFCAKLVDDTTTDPLPMPTAKSSTTELVAVMRGQSNVEFGRVDLKAGAVDAAVSAAAAQSVAAMSSSRSRAAILR